MIDSYQALVFEPSRSQLKLMRRGPLQCAAHQCLIHIEYAGVCGTDIQVMMGKFPCALPDVVLGHEISGFVVGLGSQVESIHVGQRVAVNAARPCMRCEYCKNNNYKRCSRGGVGNAIGIFRDGGWAEYCVAHEQQVFPLPSEVSLEMGVLASPMACVSSALSRLGCPPPTARVLIIGGGTVAHLMAAVIKYTGISHLVCLEERQIQKTIFRKAFPDFMVGSLNELKTQRRREGEWLLYAIIDCEGRPDLISELFSWLDLKGKLLLFGMNYSSDSLKLNPFEISQKELQVVGSSFSDPQEFLTGIKWLQLLGPKIVEFSKLGIKKVILRYFREGLEKYIVEEVARQAALARCND